MAINIPYLEKREFSDTHFAIRKPCWCLFECFRVKCHVILVKTKELSRNISKVFQSLKNGIRDLSFFHLCRQPLQINHILWYLMQSLTVVIHNVDRCRLSLNWHWNKIGLCVKCWHRHLECFFTCLQNVIRVGWNIDAGLVACTTSIWEWYIGWNLSVITSTCIDTNILHKSRADSDYWAEQAVQKAFCKCTNTIWEGARRRYPTFSTEDRLRQFLDLSFSKQIPQAFVACCQAAMQSESCVEQTAMVVCTPTMVCMHMWWKRTSSRWVTVTSETYALLLWELTCSSQMFQR